MNIPYRGHFHTSIFAGGHGSKSDYQSFSKDVVRKEECTPILCFVNPHKLVIYTHNRKYLHVVEANPGRSVAGHFQWCDKEVQSDVARPEYFHIIIVIIAGRKHTACF